MIKKYTIYYKQNNVIVEPTKAHESDAGWDIYASSEPEIIGNVISDELYSNIDYIQYRTGLYINIKAETNHSAFHNPIIRMDIKPRSSISKYNLVLANSVATIDQGYNGEIMLRFKYIFQPEDFRLHYGVHCVVNKDKIYQRGDKIAQLMIEDVNPVEWVASEELPQTNRGEGGFGSSGK